MVHTQLQSNMPRNILNNKAKGPLAAWKVIYIMVSLMKLIAIIAKCIFIPNFFHWKMHYSNKVNAIVLKINCSKIAIVGCMSVMTNR